MSEIKWFEEHVPASLIERVPEKSAIEMVAGVTLVGAGTAAGVFGIVRHKRGFLAWAIPGALIAGGLALLANRGIDRRAEHMAIVRDRVTAELSTLDPIARVQVMRDTLQDQVAFFKRSVREAD